jgi:hypothetical protein
MSNIKLIKRGSIHFKFQDETESQCDLYQLIGNTNELTGWVYLKPILKTLIEEHKKVEVDYLNYCEKKLKEANNPEIFRKLEEEMAEHSILYATDFLPRYLKSLETLVKKENVYEQWYGQTPDDNDLYDGFTWFFTIPGLIFRLDIPTVLNDQFILDDNTTITIQLNDPKYTITIDKETYNDYIRLPSVTFETEHGSKSIEFYKNLIKKIHNIQKYEIIVPFIGFLAPQYESANVADINFFAKNNDDTNDETVLDIVPNELTENTDKIEISSVKIDDIEPIPDKLKELIINQINSVKSNTTYSDIE